MVLEDFESIINLRYIPTIKWRFTKLCNYKCSYCIQRNKQVVTKQQIEEEWTKIKEESKEISRLSEELYKKFNKKIKLSLIGGEVTLFDNLIDIIPNNGSIEKVFIITNLSRPVEYYIDFSNKLKQRNIGFSIQASFHREMTDLQTFLYKATEIDKYVSEIICETVSTKTDDKQDFIDLCEKLNLKYKVDTDRVNRVGLKKYNKDKAPYYFNKSLKITYKNKEGYYNFLTRRKKYPYGIPAYGKYCSIGYSSLYIDNDKIQCYENKNLNDFHFLNEPEKCKFIICDNLCCNSLANISKNKEDVIINEEG